ncbi:MAG: diguanylate cyclase [Pseudomonadota bacterium]
MAEKNLKGLGSFWFPSLKGQEREELAEELAYHNVLRLRLGSKILIPAMLILIYIHLWVLEFKVTPGILAVGPYIVALRLIVIAASAGFLLILPQPVSPREVTAKDKFRASAHLIFLICLAALTSGIAQMAKTDLNAFIMAVFAAAAFIYMDGPGSLLTYGSGLTVVSLMVVVFQPHGVQSAVNVGAALFVTILALVISRILYLNRARDFFNGKVIEKQKQDLEKANLLLEHLSFHDGLTGLANRRHFEDFLDREWRRALREGGRLTLIMADIDFFKNYNDVYGHPAGDECLRQVAGALRRTVARPGDIVARYGGEEFIIAAANADLFGASQIGQAVCRAVENLQIEHRGSPFGRVTISLGLATGRPSREKKPADLVKAADQALYQAKASGRNQARWAGQAETLEDAGPQLASP